MKQFKFGSDFYEEHQKRISAMIETLSVPKLIYRDKRVMDVHRELMDLAIWFDDYFADQMFAEPPKREDKVVR